MSIFESAAMQLEWDLVSPQSATALVTLTANSDAKVFVQHHRTSNTSEHCIAPYGLGARPAHSQSAAAAAYNALAAKFVS